MNYYILKNTKKYYILYDNKKILQQQKVLSVGEC